MDDETVVATELTIAAELGLLPSDTLLSARQHIINLVEARYVPGSTQLAQAWRRYADACEGIVDAKRDDGNVHAAASIGLLLYKASLMRQLEVISPTYAGRLQQELEDAWEYARNQHLPWRITETIRQLINAIDSPASPAK